MWTDEISSRYGMSIFPVFSYITQEVLTSSTIMESSLQSDDLKRFPVIMNLWLTPWGSVRVNSLSSMRSRTPSLGEIFQLGSSSAWTRSFIM